jgi:hypothetical protein
MLDLYDEFATLIVALEAAGAGYAVCGGLAMAIHGFPRATIDVDLVVPPSDVESVLACARALEYTIPADPMSFAGGAVERPLGAGGAVGRFAPGSGEPEAPARFRAGPGRHQTPRRRRMMKRITKRIMKIDMSPPAVTSRLKRASQLRRLCLALGKATVVPAPHSRSDGSGQTR